MRKTFTLFLLLSTVLGCKNSNQIVPQSSQFNTVKETAQSPLVVILGSSTASGWGASDYKHAWAGLFSSYLNNGKVINLAKGGYTTYHILPSYADHQSSRPESDTLRNITAALKMHPTLLMISMTTNDVNNGYNVDEVIANLNAVRAMALANGVRHFVITTSHPRKVNAAITKKYIEQRDRVMAIFKDEAVNFFDPVADADNFFRQELLSTDGIHPNDQGHAILFDQIKTAFERNK